MAEGEEAGEVTDVVAAGADDAVAAAAAADRLLFWAD